MRWPRTRLLLAALGALGVSIRATPDAAARDPVVVIGVESLVEAGDRRQAGELLAAALHCRACHRDESDESDEAVESDESDDASRAAREGPPDRHLAPELRGVAARVRPGFLRRFLEAPHATRPGTRMPELLVMTPDARRDAIVDPLLAYLESLRDAEGPPTPASTAEPPEPAALARGERLYHEIGCIACHEPTRDPADLDPLVERQEIERDSVSLAGVGSKYHLTSLIAFLLDPRASRPATRMPRFELDIAEATDLATWLLDAFASPLDDIRTSSPAIDPVLEEPARAAALVARGAQLFREIGCRACHAIEGALHGPERDPAPAWRSLRGHENDGCLADRDATKATGSTGVPRFALDETQRVLLRDAIRAPADSGPRETRASRARRDLAAGGCLRCHERDGVGGIEPARAAHLPFGGDDLGDEGRLPPRLDHVGAKLRRSHLESRIARGGGVRTYLRIRMPGFGESIASELGGTLESLDVSPSTRPTPARDDPVTVGRNAWGRTLIGDRGLRCIHCHSLAGTPSLGIQATDLAAAVERLRPEWFRDFLLDPARFSPGTRMPAFWPGGNRPALPGLGGTADRQIDSIRVYLEELDQSRLPEGLERRGDFELVPRESPITMRTFVEGAGMQAIAIGFPSGRHVAFDAREARWALAWQGRFLDAEGTWDSRQSPPASPLGEKLISLTSLDDLAALETPDATWPAPDAALRRRYRGFRLDRARVPTLRWTVEIDGTELVAEDRMTPLVDAAGVAVGVRRELVVRASKAERLRSSALVWRVTNIGELEETTPGTWRTGEITLTSDPAPLRLVVDGVEELRAPLAFEAGAARLKVEMRW